MEDLKRTSVEEQEGMSAKEENELFCLKLVCVAIIISILIPMIIFAEQIGISPIKYEDRIAYETKHYEISEKITVKHIQKEKGKEPIYTINGSFIDDVNIPESTYLKYIGEGKNKITLKIEEMRVYLATAFFGSSFDEAESRAVMRFAFPWEDSPKLFSKEEVDEVVAAVIDTVDGFAFFSGRIYSNWDETEFSFEYDGKNYGVSFRNCLEEGATKWEKV